MSYTEKPEQRMLMNNAFGLELVRSWAQIILNKFIFESRYKFQISLKQEKRSTRRRLGTHEQRHLV